ncbi:MAG: hypothetical protein M0Z42_26705 [Actinomycetota bacterium]|jgi:hypothetical protein|nr:hypothetical protein [Actinomycetota bacterium]
MTALMRTAVSTVGALLVAASGAIHLHEWLAGYRSLPTIGPLFLAQAVTSFLLAAAVFASRRRLVMACAALFLLGTAAGYLVDVEVGLFGFQDTLANGWGQASLVVEGAGALILGAGVLSRSPTGLRSRR